MHELSICYQLAKTVEEIKKEQHLTDVDTIVLEIGEMSDILPDFLSECWLVAREQTPLKDTKLSIEIVEPVAKCLDCGKEDLVKNINLKCPCGSMNFKIIKGKEFLIKEITAR